MSTQNYAGIDIAKRNFVIGIHGKDKTKTETNNPKGFAHTVEYLHKHNVSLIVMESTGGLEIPLAKTLHRAGFCVVIANPSRTKSYANGFSLAKTDHLDAKMLRFVAFAVFRLPLPSERQPETPFLPVQAVHAPRPYACLRPTKRITLLVPLWNCPSCNSTRVSCSSRISQSAKSRRISSALAIISGLSGRRARGFAAPAQSVLC